MKQVTLRIHSLVMLFLLIFILGFATSFLWRPNTQKVEKEKNIHQLGYTYISPLLECADNQSNVSQVTSLEKEIRILINKEKEQNNIEDISVYFHNLSDDSWLSINRDNKFSPASLLKVPLMISYLKLAEENPSVLQQKIKVLPAETQAAIQNIVPEKSVIPEKEYTIEELIKYSINYSDNLAANTLLAHIDENFMNKVYTDLGLPIPGSGDIENFMTVREYASFFEILYNASYLSEKMSEKALFILTGSIFNNGLKAGIPDNVPLAHKFGERIFENSKQLHDCGIIYMYKNPYLLCVMTKAEASSSLDFSELENIISSISLKTYNHLSK